MCDKSRECPVCKEIIIYSSKYKRNRAESNNSICRLCSNKSRIGDSHPMFDKESPFKGRSHTDYSKKLISENHIDVSGENNPMFGRESAMKGKKHKDVSLDKMSKSQKGKKVSKEGRVNMSKSRIEYYKTNDGIMKGKKHSDVSKSKMRLSRIKWIEDTKNNGNPIYPCYNKSSIKILEEYSTLNNLNIQHAENGGEFFIKELGYWLDGYDIDKNIVVEFNEKHHKYKLDRDIKRRNIIMKFLKCEFHIINEDGSIETYEKENSLN